MEHRHNIGDLRQMQSLPLSAKIRMTERRITQWYDLFDSQVCILFSGGKDSTVLLDIARKLYPDIVAIFINTGLEYPSISKFALSKDNITELRPVMNFRDVITQYGYPIISKRIAGYVYSAKRNRNCVRAKYLKGEVENTIFGGNGKYWFLVDSPFLISDYCCNVMKKQPSHKYQRQEQRKPILATMAEESSNRKVDWLNRGCNTFGYKDEVSRPMSFWTEQDILQYIYENNLTIADSYGDVIIDNKSCQYITTGCKRTGCVFCGFGINKDKQRFILLSQQEPKLCDYVMRGGEFNENGMWQPNKDGLGYWFVLEWLNIHGNLEIAIPNRTYYLSTYQTNKTIKYLQ